MFTLMALLWVGMTWAQNGKKPTNLTKVAREETVYFNDTARWVEKMPEFGFLLGAMRYAGDLSSEKSVDLTGVTPLAAGVFYRKHLIPNFAFRASLMGGRLSGDDQDYDDFSWRQERNAAFTTTIGELGLQLEWDIFGKRRFRHKDTVTYTLDKYRQIAYINRFRPGIWPYLSVGGGAFFSKSNPEIDLLAAERNNQLNQANKDLAEAASAQFGLGYGFGGGFNWDLNRKWTLGAEAGLRTARSDYWDGISQLGNPDAQDWFLYGALNLSFRFGTKDRDGDGTPDKKDKCPDIAGYGHTQGCPDADGDDIADRDDACPHQRGIFSLAGCPLKDADEDGVPDVDDLCPKVAGLVAFKGCPDTDGDGIEDKLDSCATVAGIAQFFGCPDTDGDGIEDKLDACPTEKGPLAYYYGCPVRDTDKDGVPDHEDRCLTVEGKLAFKGCPDTDGDSIPDVDDLCPSIAGKLANKGCPVIEKKDQDRLTFAMKSVKFETGKAVLKAESGKILDEIAAIMKKYEGYSLKIEGHTDNVGKDEANMLLSTQRAKACLEYLKNKGVTEQRMSAQGFGKTKPLGENKTAAGKARNRRVEFHMYLPQLEGNGATSDREALKAKISDK